MTIATQNSKRTDLTICNRQIPQSRDCGKLCFCLTEQVPSDKNNLPSLSVGAVSSKVGNPVCHQFTNR